jgi:hypothetical protein
MSRIALIISLALVTLSGCVTGSRQGAREAEMELDAQQEAEIAACRCHFETDTDEYDIPCGTTYCVNAETPVQCTLDQQVVQLESECDYSDVLIPGVCITDYPGEYPIDCENIAELDECEDYGGCFVQDAPCTEADFGCEGFYSDV